MKISCIICVYNEAERIQPILKAVIGHPNLSEIIVVNDGSTDATADVVRGYPQVTLITYKENHGKTYALGQGIGAATGDTLLLLDADLVGLTKKHIDMLLAPVLSGTADMSMSLLKNCLWIHHLIGIDFVRGERVLPRSLLVDAPEVFPTLPRWGAEVFTNERVIAENLRLAIVDWPDVVHTRKYEKVGRWRGFIEEVGMVKDALSVLPLPSVVRQNVQLLQLKVQPSFAVTPASPGTA